MRKIKFRAWVYCKWFSIKPKEQINEENNNIWIDKWIMGEVKTIHFAKNKARVMDGSLSSKYHDYKIGDECIIMQSIGLKDKNGKEVYEGDIVDKTGYTFEVKYGIQGIDAFETIGYNLVSFTKDIEATGEGLVSEIEVIGNIYENPNLLQSN